MIGYDCQSPVSHSFAIRYRLAIPYPHPFFARWEGGDGPTQRREIFAPRLVLLDHDLGKAITGSHKFPSSPFVPMPWSQTPVVSLGLALSRRPPDCCLPLGSRRRLSSPQQLQRDYPN